MTKDLRFTGEWPSPELLRQYPNWENALGEEGVPGQDETTLRPCAEQSVVSDATVFTAGIVNQADGSERQAILEIDGEQIIGVDVFVDARETWRVYYDPVTARWRAFLEDWKPADERMPSVSLEDRSVFPLAVASLLPRAVGGEPLSVTIRSDGTSE